MSAIDFNRFITELADLSAEAILPFFRTNMSVSNKSEGAFDPVTEADRAAETMMRRRIKSAFPDHGIIGEEFGDDTSGCEYCWILDPIDGTKSFISGMPTWGTLIGLMRNGHPIYGMMNQPFVGERFWGDGGQSIAQSKRGNRTLHTRTVKNIEDAVLATTSPLLMKKSERVLFERVENRVKLSRYGGDCYCYCMLAAGHIDLVIEAGLAAYDIAPLIPIIKGAGGVVTTWAGENASEGGQIIASANKELHAKALELLNV